MATNRKITLTNPNDLEKSYRQNWVGDSFFADRLHILLINLCGVGSMRESNPKIREADIKEFKKILVKGYNFDKNDNHLILQKFIAYQAHNKSRDLFLYYEKEYRRVFRLLIIYNKDSKYFEFRIKSAIVFAKKRQQNDLVQMMDSILNPPQKAIRAKVIQTKIEYNAKRNEVHTTFEFDQHDPVQTVITPLKQKITGDEKKPIFDFFNKFYIALLGPLLLKDSTEDSKSDPNKNPETAIKRVYEDDFELTQGKKKFIEKIFVVKDKTKKEMIGLYLFEIIEQEHAVHGIHILIDKPYRGLGIWMFIAFRAGISLGLANPYSGIGAFVLAIDYPGFSLANKFFYFPKYKSEEDYQKVINILRIIYGHLQSVTVYADNETPLFCVKEPDAIQLKDKPESKSLNLDQEYFNEEHRGQMHDTLVPVYFKANNGNRKVLSNHVRRVGIHFFDETPEQRQEAIAFAGFLQKEVHFQLPSKL